MKKIVFTGGGSAGHVLPNVALIEILQKEKNVSVSYIGTDGVEKSVIEPYGLPYYEIRCPKLVRGSGGAALRRNLRIPFDLPRAVRQAKRALRAIQPDLVFSKGGYVALPVVLAARKLGMPCMAHESDFSAGLANRLTARFCEVVFTSFPETAKTLPHGKYSGAPIRETLFAAERSESRKRLRLSAQKPVLLVFGGGSGSRALNKAVRDNLRELLSFCSVLHVCGKDNLQNCAEKDYRQFEFVSDMATLYAASDVVLARAGAGTLFELLALKKNAVLVPLEGATRGDQQQNAAYFEKRGLCRVLPQAKLQERIVPVLRETFADKDAKKRLDAANYTHGNDVILREIKSRIGI